MRFIRSTTSVLTAGLLAFVLGCGGGKNKDAETGGNHHKGPVSPFTPNVTAEAKNQFEQAMTSFIGHDTKNDWNDGACKDTADAFDEATRKNDKFAEATYNAGLSYQRCGKDKDAREHFEQALKEDSKFHYARAQIALYQYKDDGNVDHAISELQQAVLDAGFHNVPALVDLAMFQMLRDSPSATWDKCQVYKDGQPTMLMDFECAKYNLQRALAIDDSYMPAFNQLALYYFSSAKKRVGGTVGRTVATNAALGKHADTQQLDLAALVCSQAEMKNGSYAPIHNTAGLILNENGQTSAAVREFQAAVQNDPNFFEGYMNLAAVNLSFRGFDKAQAAYEQAIKMHPNDYDAHLGRALALRGQITDGNYDAQVGAVQAELDTCKKLDPVRPDAFFNEGILTDEYKSRSNDNNKIITAYKQAAEIFRSFIDKAGSKPEYAGAVQKAKDRISDIEDPDKGKIKIVQDTIAAQQAPPPAPTPPPAPGPAPPPGGGGH